MRVEIFQAIAGVGVKRIASVLKFRRCVGRN